MLLVLGYVLYSWYVVSGEVGWRRKVSQALIYPPGLALLEGVFQLEGEDLHNIWPLGVTLT